MKKILNVEREEIFKLLADNVHVYCFNIENENIFDLYYQDVNLIHALIRNTEIVFFKIVEV